MKNDGPHAAKEQETSGTDIHAGKKLTISQLRFNQPEKIADVLAGILQMRDL